MRSVLLVEDDPNISLAFGVRLKAMGYGVHTAKDAVTAVSEVRKHHPDVVLLDISLPAGDGFLVAERIKKLVDTGSTPIIFITASNKEGLRERAMEMGAVGFLKKPFDAVQLSNAIETALYPGERWEPQVYHS